LTQETSKISQSGLAYNPSSTWSNFGDEEVDHDEKLIDQQIVFKAAMSSNYSKIIELSIISEGITKIDSSNAIIKQLGPTLRRLDLSFNHLKIIDNMDHLTNLRELTLSHNNIKSIENLQKFQQLKVLVLDYNRIEKIKNIKHLRKLEKLSLVGN
jgi:protein phosphatase 1 regulatory subunit 7